MKCPDNKRNEEAGGIRTGFISNSFEYDLPRDMIAQEPPPKRGSSRLLVLDRDTGRISHHTFGDLVEFLMPGDALVLNETKVINARLMARDASGSLVELFMVRPMEGSRWEVLARPARKVRVGEVLSVGEGQETVKVEGRLGGGRKIIGFGERNPWEVMERLGNVPLPPYIKRKPKSEDHARYQTVYARLPGAVAAPTAGLHFTEGLLREIEKMGVCIVTVCLHVGPGTFRPIRRDRIEEHKQEAEYYEVSETSAEELNRVCSRGGRKVAVGTTVVRVLETLDGPPFGAQSGWTEIYIHPPYRFKSVDALLTNFHLPRSTTLVLAASFAGRRLLGNAYEEAIREGYRFYSYGDAMLII